VLKIWGRKNSINVQKVLRGAGFAGRAHLTVSFDKILCQATQRTVAELISVSV
jgi:hypothetical protein